MSNAAPSKRAVPQGMKTLLTAASVAATLGGWAVFSTQPLPAASSGTPNAGAVSALPGAANQTDPGQQVLPAQRVQPSFGNSGSGSTQTPFGRRGRRIAPATGSSDQPSTGSNLPFFGGNSSGSSQAPMARSRSSR
jgi:hypothetical protein